MSFPARSRRFRLVSLILALLLGATALSAADAAKRQFDVPAGTLETSIKRFASQSGLEVLIRSDATGGIRTRSVQGEMTSREALDLMLHDTGLAVLQDPRSGALTVTRAAGPNAPGVVRETVADRPGTNRPVESRDANASVDPSAPLVLTPFIIEANSDVGYRASVSSSGSRLNTDYKDIASHLEVMTPDFLSDIGAFTVEEALNYSGNTESPSESWGAGAGTGDGFLGSATASMAPSRTRGLSRTTQTRNFFRTFLPYDSYNSFERGLTIASGPNPGLFGLGSPSGISNTDYNRAQLGQEKTQVRLMVDSNGSRRADVDYNLPLLRDTLALRLDGLHSDKRYAYEGNYAKDKRLTGILSWTPSRRFTMDIYGEHMDRRTSVPFYGLPTDAVTAWLNPGIGNSTPFTTPDVSPDAPARRDFPGNNTYLVNWAGGAANPPTYTFGGSGEPGVYNYRYTAVVSNLGRYANQVLQVAPSLGNPALQDERIYPFKSHALFGATRPSVLTAKNISVISNLKLAKDLFLEFGANYQHMQEKNATLFSPPDIALYIDPNTYTYAPGYIPRDPITNNAARESNRAANAANRVANPNFGSLYIDGTEAAIFKDSTLKQARLSLAYEFNPAEKFNVGPLGRWFSRQRFLGTLSSVDSALVSQRFGRSVLDNIDAAGRPVAPSVITAANALPGATRYMVAPNRVFRTRQYIDVNGGGAETGVLPLDPYRTWTFTDASGQPFDVGLVPTTVASGSRSTDDAASFVYQGYFLKNRLILTYTRSYDRVSTKQLDSSLNALSTNTGLAPYYPDVPFERYQRHPTFVNSSKSAVLHPLRWLSFHYNESTNADPVPPSSHAIDSSLNAFSNGKNKEYGIHFSWRGLGLGINQYRTWQTDVDVGNPYGNVGLVLPSDRLEDRFISLQRARTAALGLPEFENYYGKSASAPGYNPTDNGIGSGFYRMYGDNYAKGTEIELSGRVGKLDVRFAVGRTNSVKSNIGPGWLAYATDGSIFERMRDTEWYAFDSASGQYRPVVATTAGRVPVFGAPGDAPLRGWDSIQMNDTGSNLTMFDQYRQSVLPGALLVQKLTGSSNPLVREWRYNGTVAYALGRGWRVGLSVRHRAKALVGYLTDSATVDIAGNQVTTQVSDLNRPYYNPAQWYFDPFVSYRGKLGRNYDFSVQLNVFNALNNDRIFMNGVSASTANQIDVNDPRFSYYGWTDPLAIPTSMQVQDPRNFQLTLKLNF